MATLNDGQQVEYELVENRGKRRPITEILRLYSGGPECRVALDEGRVYFAAVEASFHREVNSRKGCTRAVLREADCSHPGLRLGRAQA